MKITAGKWQPAATAPKDGTVILVPFSDWSGYEAVLWGESTDAPHEENWYLEDGTDVGFGDFKYWMLFPDKPEEPTTETVFPGKIGPEHDTFQLHRHKINHIIDYISSLERRVAALEPDNRKQIEDI